MTFVLLGSSGAKMFPCCVGQYADVRENDDGTLRKVQDHTCPKCKVKWVVKLSAVKYGNGRLSRNLFRAKWLRR